MKKQGILNRDISDVVAGMGHTDTLVIADAGLPIPDCVRRIDLALTAGLPSFLDTLKVVLKELEVQEAIIAEEIHANNPELYQELKAVLEGVNISEVPHETFKKQSTKAKGIIRTGECSAYANVILVSGVTF